MCFELYKSESVIFLSSTKIINYWLLCYTFLTIHSDLYLFQIKKSRYFLNVNYKLILELESNWLKSIILDFIQLSIKSACIPHQSLSFKLSCTQLAHKSMKHSLIFYFSTRNTRSFFRSFPKKLFEFNLNVKSKTFFFSSHREKYSN